jgi:hypothetical protein
MTTKFFNKAALLAVTGLAAAAMLPASASAAETFNFASNGTNSSNTYGNVRTFTGTNGTKVEVTGYSLSGTTLASAYVGQYSNYGLGVTDTAENGSSPGHTIDNSGRVDFLILQFDKAVNVSQLGFTAWGDTDLSYAVGTTNTPFSGTLSFANWAAVDAAFNPFTASNGSSMNSSSSFTRAINGAVSGNLFFVSAALVNPDGYADYVKLKTLTETPAVPEPATWAMMIGGLGIVGMSMRRRKTAVSFA